MPIKKADLAESLKDSTESAYSLMRSPTRGRIALYLVVRNKAKKKADVAEPPEGFHHVGLLCIAPTGISRFALYIVVRKLIESCYEVVKQELCNSPRLDRTTCIIGPWE